MSMPKQLPLMRAVVMEPFIEAARQIGAPIEKMLRQAGLPTEMPADAAVLWPERPCWQFVQAVTRAEGVSDFGLMAGNSIAHQDISELAPLISGCSNLYDLLKRFCLVTPFFSNCNNYVLEDETQAIQFSQKGFRVVAEDVQVQLFEVLGMIQIVQLAAGEDWRPDEICFTFARQAEMENATELNPCRIRFSRPYPSITIPRHLLSLPVPLAELFAHSHESSPESVKPIPDLFYEGLRDAMIPYLGSTKLTKNQAAEFFGVSPRTLQRRLASEDISYSEVLDQARLTRAAELLKHKDIKLIDITMMLGYENASSFTRSFRRWTGVTPREYRSLHMNR
jgi:AraC-like DNA-binding protein